MSSQRFIAQLINDKGSHATLVGLTARMRADEVTTLLMSAACPIPSTVTWNLLRDVIAREYAVTKNAAEN